MKHLVPSLSALLLAGAATTSLSAASITDEKAGLSVGIMGILQARATALADAQDTAGLNYDNLRGGKGDPEAARFEMRRGRLGVTGAYGDGWTGSIIVAFDNVDANGYGTANGGTTNTPSTTNNGTVRPIGLYKATIAKAIKTGVVTHEIAAGYDEPFCYDYANGATTYLLPYANAATQLTNYIRGMGVFYSMTGDFYRVTGALMNNTNSYAAAPTGSANASGNDANKGNAGAVRAEIAPGAGLWTAKRQQTYAGAAGTQVLFGYDLIQDWGKQVSYTSGAGTNPWADQEVLIHGPDAQLHWDALTINAAYKFRSIDWNAKNDSVGLTDPKPVHQEAIVIEGAYAIPVDTTVIEPAFRFTHFDANKHSHAREDYSRGIDYSNQWSVPTPNTATAFSATSGSGNQIEVGVNWYLKGHSNKLQLAYVNWEASSGPARADAVVLQQQLTF